MHVILFDIDGTLLRSGGAGKEAMETALVNEFGLDRVRAEVPYSGRTDRAIARDLFAAHGIDVTPANWQRFVTAYLRLLPDCLHRLSGRVLPGIAALLQQLGGRDTFAVGLLTGNIRAGAEAKLGHFGLWGHFAFGGFGDEHHERDLVAKDALKAATDFLRRNPHPERVWVIGDTPLDVKCARAIGAKAVAVATGYHPAEELAAAGPDLLLPDLADHSPLLAKWV